MHMDVQTQHKPLTERFRVALVCALSLVIATPATAQDLFRLVVPEQRHLRVRDPAALPRARLPALPPPPTVSQPEENREVWLLNLDEAIRLALAKAEVVRVLAGQTAVSSGRTIYDAAITNTTIDQQRSVFDPTVRVSPTFNRTETPQATFDPLDPNRTIITGTQTDTSNINVGVDKRTVTGGQLSLNATNAESRFSPGVFPLNPQERSALELSLNQPLLQGGGIAPNVAPIVIASIQTERSYFQLKGSVQDLVNGVIQAYWDLVFARTNVWARQQQVDQSRFALERAQARREAGFADLAEVAQARVALANFQASLIAAEANLLDTEAALRNLLGLAPGDFRRIVPVTLPTQQSYGFYWDELVQLAEQRRPDIIELKLILEADRQQYVINKNQALPQLDAVALYRWNGLEGEMPIGERIRTEGGEFTDWTLGVNFSVPLGLRNGRAGVRRQELILARDRANLDQGLHSAIHQVASNLRFQANAYEQYEAFRETRAAAELNLEQQLEEFRSGRVIFLNVLQAIADWGNAVTSEAQALTDYNSSLAGLELETGTLLETHGIRFYEERYFAVGPLGIFAPEVCYPRDHFPGANADRYPEGDKPSEEFFNLQPPVIRESDRRPDPPVQGPPELIPRPQPEPQGSLVPQSFDWIESAGE